jgi:hypothetical protein
VNDTAGPSLASVSLSVARLMGPGSSQVLSQISGFTVTLTTTPANGISAYAVEENVPNGFAVNSITGGGDFDATNGRVKWGPFFDNQTRTLSYVLTPPAGFTGQVTLSGVGSYDGADVPVTGDRMVGTAVVVPTNSATRTIQTVEGKIQVAVAVAPISSVVAYALEESVPASWTVT